MGNTYKRWNAGLLSAGIILSGMAATVAVGAERQRMVPVTDERGMSAGTDISMARKRMQDGEDEAWAAPEGMQDGEDEAWAALEGMPDVENGMLQSGKALQIDGIPLYQWPEELGSVWQETALLPLPVVTEETEGLEETLPTRYDVRDRGQKPIIKSQGGFGTCWALTVTSALEAIWMEKEHLVFSADHISLNNGFNITQNEGGDYLMAMAYLSGWYGPVLEEEDPYGDEVSPEGLEAGVHVQEMQLLEGLDGEEIKQMIYEYGPVQTSLYMDRRVTASAKGYYHETNYAFYYPQEETPTHDVLILGWDDTYPKENFEIMPKEDGAYICQNTWGERFGDQGIFYVSYEDANIAQGGVAYTKVESTDNYDRIYQTDVCGWQGQQGYDEESCYFANVYTAESAETLEAVGFYTTDFDSYYEVYVVKQFEDAASFDNREFLTSGQIENSGYFTIELEDEVELEAGERFAVVVNITTPGATNPVAVEMHKDIYSETVTLEGKEGYLSYNGDVWELTEEKFQTNVCLKAYTRIR